MGRTWEAENWGSGRGLRMTAKWAGLGKSVSHQATKWAEPREMLGIVGGTWGVGKVWKGDGWEVGRTGEWARPGRLMVGEVGGA